MAHITINQYLQQVTSRNRNLYSVWKTIVIKKNMQFNVNFKTVFFYHVTATVIFQYSNWPISCRFMRLSTTTRVRSVLSCSPSNTHMSPTLDSRWGSTQSGTHTELSLTRIQPHLCVCMCLCFSCLVQKKSVSRFWSHHTMKWLQLISGKSIFLDIIQMVLCGGQESKL